MLNADCFCLCVYCLYCYSEMNQEKTTTPDYTEVSLNVSLDIDRYCHRKQNNNEKSTSEVKDLVAELRELTCKCNCLAPCCKDKEVKHTFHYNQTPLLTHAHYHSAACGKVDEMQTLDSTHHQVDSYFLLSNCIH
jgi:hypothetical protein